MTRTEWIRMEEEITNQIEDLEDRYNYIRKVWSTMYGNAPKQQEAIKAMAARFEELQTTDLEKYVDTLEDFVEYMEEASIYVKPT